MDFFSQDAAKESLNTTENAKEFSKYLESRSTFVMTVPSPRMAQALSQHALTNKSFIQTNVPPDAAALSKTPPRSNSTGSSLSKDLTAELFKRFSAKELLEVIDHPTTLVIDLRPHGAWKTSRVRRSINLAVPSTLLRRPTFSLDKLTTMLPSQVHQLSFAKWSSASVVVAYDADSLLPSDASNITSLLTKLKASGAKAELGYLSGGFNALLSSGSTQLLDFTAEEDAPADPQTPQSNAVQFVSASQLEPRAFQQGSTTAASQRPESGSTEGGAPGPMTTRVTATNPFFESVRQNRELQNGITETIPLYIPKRVLRRNGELPFEWLRRIGFWAGGSLEALPGAEDSAGLSTGADNSRHSGDLKNQMEEGKTELSQQFFRVESMERSRVQGAFGLHSRQSGTLSTSSDKQPAPGTEGKIPSMPVVFEGEVPGDYFPYSLLAGVEKGFRNRYNNIYPFDHSRVRLQRPDSGDDYINASYVQPSVTHRQYIATQGPLEDTFDHFWMLIWEQNVRIVVNLTKRFEGPQVKCGMYWKSGTYGDVHVRLVREDGGTDLERAEEANENVMQPRGFDFGGLSAKTAARRARQAKRDMRRQVGHPEDLDVDEDTDEETSSSGDEDDSIIRREFRVWHDSDPHNVRTIVQFQYVGWPDLATPTSPKYLLKLITEINQLYEEYQRTGAVGAENAHSIGDRSNSAARSRLHSEKVVNPPPNGKRWPNTQILVHCSAGVGRTGSFVLVDAILDAVRRETRAYFKRGGRLASPTAGQHDDVMELDQSQNSSSVDLTSPPDIQDLRSGAGSSQGSAALRMEALSMRTLSASPPAPSVLAHSPGAPSLQPVISPPTLTRSPFPMSSIPDAALKSPSLLERRRKQSSLDSSTMVNPLSSMLTQVDNAVYEPSSQGHNTPTTPGVFDWTVPRQINVPRHARQYHNKSYMDKLIQDHAERRRKQAERQHREWLPPTRDEDTTPSSDGDLEDLSSLQNPVLDILKILRTQRMSLCQSLRQYVFVHRAVFEGAMAILDELRSEMADKPAEVPAIEHEEGSLPMDLSSPQKEVRSPYEATGSGVASPFAASVAGNPYNLSGLFAGPSSDFLKPSPSSGLGKRLASPTELPRTDNRGAHTVAKRPSLKRINKSLDGESSLQPR